MSFFASLNGEQIVSGRFTIPYFGVWTGQVELATSAPAVTLASVVVGNLSLTCKSKRTAAYGGTRSYLLAGGNGGWSTLVGDQYYNDPSGVRLSTILGDVASACGERVAVAQDRVLGPAWTRMAAKGQETLRALLGAAWYVDPTGTTQCQDRTAKGAITTPFTVENYNAAQGRVTIATEDLASWMPGRKFSAPVMPSENVVSDVSFTFGADGKLRVEALLAA